MTPDDRTEIVDLINLYALAVDTQKWDLFRRVFTPDVDAEFGSGSHWKDLDSFIRDFGAFHDPFDATQHTMSNHQVVVDGDRANALTYGHWRLIRDVPGGNMWEGAGWYDDELVRTGAGWRINKRVCRVIWWGGNNAVRQITPDTTFNDDPISLRGEAALGNVAFVNAIATK